MDRVVPDGDFRSLPLIDGTGEPRRFGAEDLRAILVIAVRAIAGHAVAENNAVHVLDQGAEPLLAFPQALARFPFLGDLATHAAVATERAGPIDYRPAARPHDPRPAGTLRSV